MKLWLRFSSWLCHFHMQNPEERTASKMKTENCNGKAFQCRFWLQDAKWRYNNYTTWIIFFYLLFLKIQADSHASPKFWSVSSLNLHVLGFTKQIKFLLCYLMVLPIGVSPLTFFWYPLFIFVLLLRLPFSHVIGHVFQFFCSNAFSNLCFLSHCLFSFFLYYQCRISNASSNSWGSLNI